MNIRTLAAWLEDTIAVNGHMAEVAAADNLIDARSDFERAAQRARNMRAALPPLGTGHQRKSVQSDGPRAA